MTHSETITDLLNALCAARLEFPAIVRNCSAIARGGREYQYADLSAIAEATAGVLAQHGLVLVQAVEDGDTGQLCISSTLYHTSGQWLQCALSVPKPTAMQEVGAISTYIRRYQQSSMLNIATEDDDDAASTHGATTEPSTKAPAAPIAAANGHTPSPDVSLEHPTESHLAALRNLAVTECGEDVSVYEDRLRRTLKVPPHASVSPRLLTRSMTMVQYMEVFAYYQRLEAQLAKGRETPHGITSAHTAVSQPTATEEASPAVPSPDVSSSADAAAERDRQRLRQEVAAWNLRVPPEEVEHVIMHNPYSKARALLWKCRRTGPRDTPVESAAD
jgi:hypothetical protein